MDTSTNIHIRLSELKDIPAMSLVEHSAQTAFLTIPELAWVADGHVLAHEEHRKAIMAKTSWVSEDKHSHRIIGFLSAEALTTEFHLSEVSVHADFQRQGIGRKLIETAVQYAASRGALTVTLTTFMNVPWNAPFYKKMGFDVIEDGSLGERLSGLLLEEKSHGLSRDNRCAMRKSLAGLRQR
ncbi:GNAT family N-acetyltransferase [Hellea sp.]|nr:GNAT family N-acetyltransferase [Hellea sp.]